MNSDKIMLILTVFTILIAVAGLIYSIVRICYMDFIPIIIVVVITALSFIISKIIQEVFM